MRGRKALGPRARRQRRVRAKVSGVAERPRLNVFRSNQHIYAQVVDDSSHHTLAAASTLDPAVQEALEAKQAKQAQAAAVGRVVAERAREKGIETVVFDRGGYRYHGRVRALAEAAREAGLKF
ncbi:MAG: 50S ribosomal protein L18 [Chloroflexota bacterium]|nr:50S ribosomal protein L18 [Chloroflexota bacterium]MDE2841331.1 50S ribosomal protein L18 [Chloroflexota bacterium]MDE2929787.1 50S ribosomal protein L18 [Chloroflexota bacterium]